MAVSNFPTYHVKFAKTDPRAIIPSKNSNDAGFDIYIISDEDDVCINPGETVMLSTGLAYEITSGWHLIAKERGSTGKIALKTSAGVNDNSYRGVVNAFLHNGNFDKTIVITRNQKASECAILEMLTKGSETEFDKSRQDEYIQGGWLENFIFYPMSKAVQQLVPIYSPDGTSEEVPFDQLSQTERGNGMTGSSGK